jgi:glycosyltransferase involved in cell wall biosynthesis
MNSEQIRVLHLPKYPARKGGMDALLRLHEKQGETVLGLLKSQKKPSIGFTNLLPFSWQKSPLKKLQETSAMHDVSLYYNCWGADLFTNYDQAAKRIGYLHNHFPNFEKYIRYFAPHLDGFLTVNSATTRRARTLLQNTHPADSIQTVQLPIHPPNSMPNTKKEDIIGLIGRVNYQQKRYDRLPEFAKILLSHRPEACIEVLGDGPNKPDLIKKTKNSPKVRYLPWTNGADYWKVISRWKFVLFLSDYEGLPIALLEAIHAHCIPIYPDLHQGDRQGLPLQLYPKGNMHAAVNRVLDCSMDCSKQSINSNIHTNHNHLNYLSTLTQSIIKIKSPKGRNPGCRLGSLNTTRYNKQYARLLT